MVTQVLEVAKKPNKSMERQKQADRHSGSFMLRLPEEYRDILRQIMALTGRPMTIATQIAIEKEARELGISFKPNWPQLAEIKKPD